MLNQFHFLQWYKKDILCYKFFATSRIQFDQMATLEKHGLMLGKNTYI